MNYHTLKNSIVLAGMMAASLAFAGNDIVKCVDQEGHVTLTDSPCQGSVETVLVAGGKAAAPEAGSPAAGRAVTMERIPAVRAPVRHDTWAYKGRPDRMLAGDVATLKAARLSMQMLDSAASVNRHQRLARLN